MLFRALVPKNRAQKQPLIKERGFESPDIRGSTEKIKETYDIIRQIGHGGQGKLFVVKRKRDKKILVRKEQKRYDMYGSVPCEMYIFEKVLTHHPNILDFDRANYIEANGSLVLYFEFCKGGDLLDYIPRVGENRNSESFLWQCLVQLADAIAFLHYGYNRFANNPNTPPRSWKRVIHRDIKPENVFLRRDMTGRNPVPDIVLGDFGLATLEAESYGAGTKEWMAPEIPLVTKESDVWGVGAVIHALAHGEGPVPRPPRDWDRSKDRWRENPQARQPMQLPTFYSDALNRHMMACLEKDPGQRTNSLQLVQNLGKAPRREGIQ